MPPASPPLPPLVWKAAPVEPVSENLAEGWIRLAATVACLPFRLDMPAGLKNMVVASSAAASPPANALPSPLLCSINANADAAAFPDNASNAPATATPDNDCLNFIFVSP